MSKYRLDDLIRKGAELTNFRRFEVYDKQENSACANGAAMIGLRKIKGQGMPEESILTAPRSIGNISHISIHEVPDCVQKKTYLKDEVDADGKVLLTSAIVVLNDLTDGMNRKGIAEWVGWLIDEKGYDLTVSIDDEEDEKENEEDEEERELQPA